MTGHTGATFEMLPITPAGQRFAELARTHAPDFASRAERHDREGTFPTENIEALRRSGAAGATVPAELGGLGVDSIHDYVVGIIDVGPRHRGQCGPMPPRAVGRA